MIMIIHRCSQTSFGTVIFIKCGYCVQIVNRYDWWITLRFFVDRHIAAMIPILVIVSFTDLQV